MNCTTCETGGVIFQLPSDIEPTVHKKNGLEMNAWSVQNIVFELIKNYMLSNSPQDLGFTFTQKHTDDPTTNQIFLDISFNWRKDQQGKRPAIFVERGALSLDYPTFGAQVGGNIKESESERMAIQKMPITVSCLATNLGFTEMLAEYVKQPLLSFRKEIRRDFGFREFALTTVGKPQAIQLEGKDHFYVELGISTAFDDRSMVKGDDLKLKTISKFIFDEVTSKPLKEQ
jgi:hypothetical protein